MKTKVKISLGVFGALLVIGAIANAVDPAKPAAPAAQPATSPATTSPVAVPAAHAPAAGPTTPASITNASQILDRLTHNGAPCGSQKPANASSVAGDLSDIACTADPAHTDRDTIVIVFDTHAHAAAYARSNADIDLSAGGDSMTVLGPNWVISTTSGYGTKALAALGGTKVTGTPLVPATPSPAPAPARKAAAVVLNASIKHYADEFAQGQKIIGHTQYADGAAGLAAMDDPTSAAAKFRDYRQNPNPEMDLSYNDAFTTADANFTADDEPASISTWRNDMYTLQADISGWVGIAVGYQISSNTQGDLDTAAAKVLSDISTVKADATDVAAGK